MSNSVVLDNNQNRFRIYFESPPEADRVPQALRRNPYKRWRREDSTAPAAGQDGKKADAAFPEIEETAEAEAAVPDGEDEAPGEADEATIEAAAEEALPESAQEDAAAEGADPTVGETPNDPASATEPIAAVNTGDEYEDLVTTANDLDQLNGSEVEADLTVPATNTTDASHDSSASFSEITAPAAEVVNAAQAIASDPSSVDAGEETTDRAASAPMDPSLDTGLAGTTETAAVEMTTTSDEATATPIRDSGLPAASASESAEMALSVEKVEPVADQAPSSDPKKATAEEDAAALAKSAENAASAYKTRTRRRSSVSSTDSRETVQAFQPEVTPSLNRLSILYEGSQRRMCFDAEVVEKIRVFRDEGRIEVLFVPITAQEVNTVKEDGSSEVDKLLPKGYLVGDDTWLARMIG